MKVFLQTHSATLLSACVTDPRTFSTIAPSQNTLFDLIPDTYCAIRNLKVGRTKEGADPVSKVRVALLESFVHLQLCWHLFFQRCTFLSYCPLARIAA